jgi:hypothetical protein
MTACYGEGLLLLSENIVGIAIDKKLPVVVTCLRETKSIDPQPAYQGIQAEASDGVNQGNWQNLQVVPRDDTSDTQRQQRPRGREHMNKKELTCRFCLHHSTPDDRVMLYWVGGKGDMAQCVDGAACVARQKRARELSKPGFLVGVGGRR